VVREIALRGSLHFLEDLGKWPTSCAGRLLACSVTVVSMHIVKRGDSKIILVVVMIDTWCPPAQIGVLGPWTLEQFSNGCVRYA